MKRIYLIVIIAIMATNLVQAKEQREVVVSKFKKQATTITPLSITKFEIKDKHGKTKIIDLKGKSL